MNLQKGQRWKYSSTGMVLEIIDPVRGQCVVRCKGKDSYDVGYVDFWASSLARAIRRYNENAEIQTWEYLAGQDAPM